MPKVDIGIANPMVFVRPTREELSEAFAPHNLAKILRPLDLATGDVTRGEVQCTGISCVVYNAHSIQVHYDTLWPDGARCTQFMRFWSNESTMRCLAVTKPIGDFGPRVVMINEFRRQQGAWAWMCVAGGTKIGGVMDTLKSELFDEAGCSLSNDSYVTSIGDWFMDDGVFAEPLTLLTVDCLNAPDAHVYPEESVRGIALVPWHEWRSKALAGGYDVYSTIFAARCDLSRDGRVLVNGKQLRLR